MILDSTNLFSNAQAITVTADSTNEIDLGVARDLGTSDLKLMIVRTAAFTAGGAGTLQIAFQGAPDNGSGLPGAYVTYAQSIALSLAQLNALPGFLFPINVPRIPSPAVALPRFYKLVYTVGTGPMLTGALSAGLVLGRDDNIAYPKNYNTAGVFPGLVP